MPSKNDANTEKQEFLEDDRWIDTPGLSYVTDVLAAEAAEDLSSKDNYKPILIFGPTGTGKNYIADKILKISGIPDEKSVRINCAAFPESLIESELFGYVKGAFTGAT